MRSWKRMTAAVVVFSLLCALPVQGAPDSAAGLAMKNTGSAQVSQTGPSGETQAAGPTAEGSGSAQVSLTGPSGTSGGGTGSAQTPEGPSGGGNGFTQTSEGPGTENGGFPQTTGAPGAEDTGSGQTSGGPAAGSAGSTQTSSGPAAGSAGSAQTSGGPTGSTGSAQVSQPPAAASGNGGSLETTVTPPEIRAEGAVVIDAATGAILYGKNETERFYPASITKLMTAMVVLERTNLSDVVTFSRSATTNLESGASSLNLTEGDQLTVEQCLYGLLLKSANEIGNALAEHVSGSVAAFAQLMNERAAQLGCRGTHFANPHGLNDSSHYTTPYDMALVGRAAFQNQTLCRIDTTLSYSFPATKKEAARTISMGHKMMYPTDSRYYEGIVGGKTGYTSLAGNTLVTGVERDGVRLVAVVMKSRSTHYEDTKALLDYGFAVMNQSKAGAGSGSPAHGDSSQTPAAGWAKDDRGWQYIKQDGKQAAGEWIREDQTDYWIDSDGYMATGWRQFAGGEWYYFRSGGAKAVNYWVMDYGKWFYLGDQGRMLADTVTPDGYVLGADGAWIQ